MATPQPGQAPYGQPGHDPHSQEQLGAGQPGDTGQQPTHTAPPASSAAGRKKRGYAGQAYEFGGGPNAALGGQQPAGGAYPAPVGAAAAGYGGYGQQPGAPQAPAYGAPQSPAYGAPISPAVGGAPGYGQQAPGVGGYQSPDPGYPAGAHQPPAPGVGGITQSMNSLTVQPQTQGRLQLNQLYPTDLLNTALNVGELDLPPPPIILPANVSFMDFPLVRNC